MELKTDIGAALSTDYFGLRQQLTPEQLDYLLRTREFVERDVHPVINDYWERAEFPRPLIAKMAEYGIVGAAIKGYGCPPMDSLSAGLIQMELHRGDGSLGTFLGVQGGLAMHAIAELSQVTPNPRSRRLALGSRLRVYSAESVRKTPRSSVPLG